jgi:hypothetical protein
MKLYKLYVPKPVQIYYLFMLAAMPIAGITLTVVAALGKMGPDGPPFWIFIPVLGVLCFVPYMWLRIAFEIRISDDAKIEFRNIFRTTVVTPAEIKSVRAKRYALGFVDIVHLQGTVHLLNQMDGFHEFITTVKSMNPAVEIKGC